MRSPCDLALGYNRICLKALKKNFSGFVRSEVLKLRKVKKSKANKEKQKKDKEKQRKTMKSKEKH